MEYEETCFNGKDGSSRFFRTWSPKGDTKALVLISHGYAEHSGRYEEVAQALTESGFAVWAHDHYGHGKSDGPRALIERIELAAEDMLIAIETASALFGDIPLFLYGHSMGGSIVALTAAQHSPPVSGIIFSGAAVRVMGKTSAAVRAAIRLIRLFAPAMPIQPLNIEYLSHYREVKDAYLNDPLTYTGKMKAAMGLEIMEAEKMLNAEALSRITVPALIIHGSEDHTVPPESSHQLYEQIGSEDKTLRFFEGAYHEIHNEECAEEVIALVTEWLDSHIPKAFSG